METQEEEFICSDCGAIVPADAKFCPNCGVSLENDSGEDSSKEIEYDLIEIPLTTDPAKLSAIISLLDEKKIDYSINENAMENIWGPTYFQPPRLLIRADLEEEVSEIIESVDDEEIEIIETEIFKDSESEEKKKTKNLKGVEGWLLVISLLLMLGPVAYIPYYIYDFFENQNYLIMHPFTFTLVTLDLIISIYISFLSVNAGYNLYNTTSGAVEKAIKFFNIFIAYQLIAFLALLLNASIYDFPLNSTNMIAARQIISKTIYVIVFAIEAKLYLQNSERVKRTFGTKMN